MMKLFRYSIKTLPITGSPIFINHIGIENEKAKVTRTIKDSAKKGDVDSCRILAKEVIRAKKAVNKLYASKAQLSSVEMSMKNQLATLRVSGSLQKSSEVMKYMQELVKLPEIQATMQELSKEMMKVRWFKIPEDCDI
jgi:charged multivesicular body protein 3